MELNAGARKIDILPPAIKPRAKACAGNTNGIFVNAMGKKLK